MLRHSIRTISAARPAITISQLRSVSLASRSYANKSDSSNEGRKGPLTGAANPNAGRKGPLTGQSKKKPSSSAKKSSSDNDEQSGGKTRQPSSNTSGQSTQTSTDDKAAPAVQGLEREGGHTTPHRTRSPHDPLPGETGSEDAHRAEQRYAPNNNDPSQHGRDAQQSTTSSSSSPDATGDRDGSQGAFVEQNQQAIDVGGAGDSLDGKEGTSGRDQKVNKAFWGNDKSEGAKSN